MPQAKKTDSFLRSNGPVGQTLRCSSAFFVIGFSYGFLVLNKSAPGFGDLLGIRFGQLAVFVFFKSMRCSEGYRVFTHGHIHSLITIITSNTCICMCIKSHYKFTIKNPIKSGICLNKNPNNVQISLWIVRPKALKNHQKFAKPRTKHQIH